MLQTKDGTRLVLRHAISEANEAREAALRKRESTFSYPPDPRLTVEGTEQARELGRWFATVPEHLRPTLWVISPATRIEQTLKLLIEAAGWDRRTVKIVRDARLGEREVGLEMSRYTSVAGFFRSHPWELQEQKKVGFLEYQPPDGKSYRSVLRQVFGLWAFIENTFARKHPNIAYLTHGSIIKVIVYIMAGLNGQVYGSNDQVLDPDEFAAIMRNLLEDEKSNSVRALDSEYFARSLSIGNGMVVSYDWDSLRKRPRGPGQSVGPDYMVQRMRR